MPPLVHVWISPRTKEVKSTEPATHDWLPELVKAVRVPVIINGDLYTYEDVARVRALPGCSDCSVMLARPALFNTSVFSSIRTQGGPLKSLVEVRGRGPSRSLAALCHDSTWLTPPDTSACGR